MFTMTDIRSIAMQIEANGEETYRQAAARSRDPERRRLFVWMADEERNHREQFAKLAVDGALTPEQAELERMGRALLEDIVRSQTFSLDEDLLDEAAHFGALLDQAIEFEQDTIRFYEFLAGFLDGAAAAKQMETIINQEREHVRMLQQLHTTSRPA